VLGSALWLCLETGIVLGRISACTGIEARCAHPTLDVIASERPWR
jgi:hypothetical protein